MRRLVLGLIALTVGCSGCTSFILRHTTPKPTGRHTVRVLWVDDAVMRQLDSVARDTVEAIFQIEAYDYGKLADLPDDTGYVVTRIRRCPAAQVSAMRLIPLCPNSHAPTIHLHISHGAILGTTGNTCSPSRADYALQLQRRHLFDAVLCGPGTRPTAFWFYGNPLLGTKEFPDTLSPAAPDYRVSRTP